jgi:tRNA A-37 threonylcarbamoyl transferase component Bud32
MTIDQVLRSPAPAPTPRRHGRQRRPSGTAPPLPRHLGRTGAGWLVVAGVVVAWLLVAVFSSAARQATDRLDSSVLRGFATLRTDAATTVMSGIARAGSGWWVTAVALALIVALMLLKRWHHLFTFLGAMLLLAVIGSPLYDGFARPRPFDVTIIGRWAGYSLPAPPVAVVTMLVVGIVYTLVPAGHPRQVAKVAAGVVVGALATSALYLATYHPSDLIVGITLATAIGVNAFRYFTPNEFLPVTYTRGKTAHLDVTGSRGDALRSAVKEQLGLTVVELRPVGLEGSGGSTPLRIKVSGDPDSYLFGKLYAMSHVRADRWYKLGRTLLYGRLEDESPFQSVRRLVEYEDYRARLLRDVGIPTAAPYGIIEMTPEREYLLVTEFFDGAEEIGDAVVDEGVIDEGLGIIRKLWDAGLAHRDIKPANLLVRDGHVLVIDVAFVQVRPSPWRQAVDLANMMLVLAVRSDAERVYERARLLFTDDEISEAFAAARGAASPTQLRTAMKQDGRDLLQQFRTLAPRRRPISLQRWNAKRVGLTVVIALGLFVVLNLLGELLSPSYTARVTDTPECRPNNAMILVAQAVPSATALPCVAALPAGWSVGEMTVRRGEAGFWLESDQGGDRAVVVTLRPEGECSVESASEVPSDEPDMQRFERVGGLPPHLQTTRTYLFDGGCVTYAYDIEGPDAAALTFDADAALAFLPRDVLVEGVRSDLGLRLCGAGAPCPGGK